MVLLFQHVFVILKYQISLKNKEKLYETMNHYYRENIIRFDKAFEEFKTANNHLQTELKELI